MRSTSTCWRWLHPWKWSEYDRYRIRGNDVNQFSKFSQMNIRDYGQKVLREGKIGETSTQRLSIRDVVFWSPGLSLKLHILVTHIIAISVLTHLPFSNNTLLPLSDNPLAKYGSTWSDHQVLESSGPLRSNRPTISSSFTIINNQNNMENHARLIVSAL